MKIVVVNGYVRQNAGDAALMSVLCVELERVFSDATVVISSQEKPSQYPSFERRTNIGSFSQYVLDPNIGSLRRYARALLAALAPILIAIRPGLVGWLTPKFVRSQCEEIGSADLIVSMGGGYLNGSPSRLSTFAVYLMLLPLIIGRQLGKCVVCAPQSVGPFGSRLQERLVRYALNRVDLIMAREEITVTVLDELRVESRVVRAVDAGFLFESDQSIDIRDRFQVPSSDLLVGVTVRKWLAPSQQADFEAAIAAGIDHLTAKSNVSVILIPQVVSYLGGDDDRNASFDVYRHIHNKDSVRVLADEYTHHEIKAVYDGLDLLIGTRFHSVIFSLTSYVPALAIEYEHKTRGIMRDLGLESWTIKIGDVTADVLKTKIDDLLGATDAYAAHLRKVLPIYIQEAQNAVTMIRETYDSAKVSSER